MNWLRSKLVSSFILIFFINNSCGNYHRNDERKTSFLFSSKIDKTQDNGVKIQIIRSGAPLVLDKPETITCQAGSKDGTPEISWLLDNSPLQQKMKIMKYTISRHSTFTTSRVTFIPTYSLMNKTIVCQAKLNQVSTSDSIVLNVKGALDVNGRAGNGISWVARNQHEIKFDCPQPTGLFPYPPDCSKFLSCSHGVSHRMRCPPGTSFNTKISDCDYRYNVNCNNNYLTYEGDERHISSNDQRKEDTVISLHIGTVAPMNASSVENFLNPSRNKIIHETMEGCGGINKNTESIDTILDNVDRISRQNKTGRYDKPYEDARDCPSPNGAFPYKKNCAKYISCWKSRPHIQTCGPGTLFNPLSKQCDYKDRVKKYCQKQTEVVDLTAPKTIPSSGQTIRLRGAGVPWAGYVEVKIKDRWLLLSTKESPWTTNEGHVICRMLGFSRGSESVSSGIFYNDIKNSKLASFKRIACSGDEAMLNDCVLRSTISQNSYNDVVGVKCLLDYRSECPVDWYPWGGKCYKVAVDVDKVSYSEARQACNDQGAKLVSIQSQKQNDFLSELTTWLAGDVDAGSIFYTAGKQSIIFDTTYWIWLDHELRPHFNLTYSIWWPGWVADSAARSANMFDEENTRCIVLQNAFPQSSANKNNVVNVDYFFWKLIDCTSPGYYICELPKKDIGCVSGRGQSYNGTANVSGVGTSCMKWSDLLHTPQLHALVKSVTINSIDVNDAVHALGLTNNCCANPDYEEAPYCYVSSEGLIEFCDIPRCKESDGHTDSQHIQDDSHILSSQCLPNHYQCPLSSECILKDYVCDGQNDCSNGADELGCPDYTQYFSKFEGKRLMLEPVETWINSPKIACSARCAEAKTFICKSYNYREDNETCELFEYNAGDKGKLSPSAYWEYHESLAHGSNCTFKCHDFLCLKNTQICDAKKDCHAGEDEINCPNMPDVEVRLVNGSEPHEGRVEVKVNNTWGPVCDDMWGTPEADVICHQLGYTLGARYCYKNSKYGSGSGQYLIDDLNCKGNEKSIAHCSFDEWGVHDCNENEAAGVKCFTHDHTCSHFELTCNNGRCVQFRYWCDGVNDCQDESDENQDLCKSPVEARLNPNKISETIISGNARTAGNVSINSSELPAQNTSIVSAGRVEIRYQGVWGTVCDDDFDIEDGNVVCKMLGFAGVVSIQKDGWWGPGDGIVWLDDVKCSGSEHSLTECSHSTWGESNCQHKEDVGVECTNNLHEAWKGVNDSSPDKSLKLPQMCGVRSWLHNIHSSARIVKGHASLRGAHPWMVGIMTNVSGEFKHWCGASIITEDILLTAAHCVKNSSTTFLLKIGDFDTTKPDVHEKEYMIESIIRHSMYNIGPRFNNDIALIKIKRQDSKGIKFNDFIQPVCLPSKQFDYPEGLMCVVAGWGETQERSFIFGRSFSKILKAVSVPLISNEKCRSRKVYEGFNKLSEGMICAGYLEGGIDACSGDSGGPLVCNINGHYTAVGITSWGEGCAKPNKPGVYTKVTNYLDWIYDNI